MAELVFGEPLGSLHGVTAYSNLDDSFFSGEKHHVWGVYTGYKYQCVEFARRYLLLTRGCQFGQCFRAAEIFHMTSVTNVETGEVFALTQCKNGKTTTKPQPGHILVYPHDQELMPVGHVAVIAEVGEDWVGIAEQNQDSFSWRGASFGRRIPLRQGNDGCWTMEETDPELLQPDGWLFAEEAKIRDDVHAPLAPLESFLPSKDEFAFSRHRVVVLNDQEKEDRKAWRLSHIPPTESDAEKMVEDKLFEHDPNYLAHMKSIIYPSEGSGVGCIGTLNATFRCIGHGLQLIFQDDILRASQGRHASLDQWAAERFGMPLELVSVMRGQLSTADLHACSVGSMSMQFNTNGPVVISCNMDSIQYLFEASILQARICMHNGHEEGWTPSITNDMKRFVEKVVRGHNKAELIYFLDLGESSSLSDDTFDNHEDRHAYDMFRLNAMILVDFIKKSFPDAARVVRPENVCMSECGAAVVRESGDHVRKVHRMCSWRHVFRVASQNASLNDIVIGGQRSGNVSFYPPLFTHITASDNFLCDLHAAYSLRDTTKLDEGLIELAEFLPPLQPGEPSVFSSGEEPNKQKFRVQVRGISVGGYWSTGVFLESLGTRWTPACYRFIMHKREFSREEVAED